MKTWHQIALINFLPALACIVLVTPKSFAEGASANNPWANVVNPSFDLASDSKKLDFTPRDAIICKKDFTGDGPAIVATKDGECPAKKIYTGPNLTGFTAAPVPHSGGESEDPNGSDVNFAGLHYHHVATDSPGDLPLKKQKSEDFVGADSDQFLGDGSTLSASVHHGVKVIYKQPW